jgi:hypothetical protein
MDESVAKDQEKELSDRGEDDEPVNTAELVSLKDRPPMSLFESIFNADEDAEEV